MQRVKDHLFADERVDRIAEWEFTLGLVVLFGFLAVRFGRDFADTLRYRERTRWRVVPFVFEGPGRSAGLS